MTFLILRQSASIYSVYFDWDSAETFDGQLVTRN